MELSSAFVDPLPAAGNLIVIKRKTNTRALKTRKNLWDINYLAAELSVLNDEWTNEVHQLERAVALWRLCGFYAPLERRNSSRVSRVNGKRDAGKVDAPVGMKSWRNGAQDPIATKSGHRSVTSGK